MSPENAEALNNLAYIYHEAGDSRAIDFAGRAYDLAPENPDIMDTYGWILASSGQTEKGTSILRAAVEQAPDNAEYRLHLAAALIDSNDSITARKTLLPLLRGQRRSGTQAQGTPTARTGVINCASGAYFQL